MSGLKFEYLNPYIVVWEFREGNETSDPNPTLTTKGPSKVSKWKNMLPFSQANTPSSTTPRPSMDQRGPETVSSPTKSSMTSSPSFLDMQEFEEEEEEFFSKKDGNVDTSGYKLWREVVQPVVEKSAVNFDMKGYNFKGKNPLITSNVYLKTVQKMSIDYVTSNHPQCRFSRHWNAWYRNPYFHLCLVKCEDTDQFTNFIKPKLDAFTNYMNDKDYSYLILYIQQSSKKFSFFNSIYTQLSKDYKDNVVKVSEKTFTADFVQKDVAGKIRDGVIYEFVRRVTMYEKEMKKSESNRSLPGWQFCHFFLIKEGLAFTFEQFKLFVNAHGMYQQLMAFLNSSPDAAKFSSFVNSDLSLYPILDTTAKDFRQLMYETTISEFDFNNYVFARQVHLLFRLENPDMVAELAAMYIPDMMYQLQDYFFSQEVSVDETDDQASKDVNAPRILLKLFPYRKGQWTDDDIKKFLFLRSWAYCAAENVVSRLEAVCKNVSEKQSGAQLLFRRTGDLYMLSRFQLNIIGNVFGLTAFGEDQGTGEVNEKLVSHGAELMDFSNTYDPAKRLAAVVQSQFDFDTLYTEISTAASIKYEKGNRNRFVNKLAAEMASIQFREKNYEHSLIALQPIVNRYESDYWDVLKLDTERKLAECEKKIGRVEYYVKCCVDLVANQYYMNELKTYMGQITEEVEATIPRNAMRVGIESITGKAEAQVENGAIWKFALVFYNDNFQDFTVDEVVVVFQEKLQEGKPNYLQVQASGFTLSGEAKQKIQVRHRMNTVGIFQVAAVKLKIHKLTLLVPIEYDHPPTCLPQEQLHKQREPLVTTRVLKREKKTHVAKTSSGNISDIDSLGIDTPLQQTTVLTYFEPGFIVTSVAGEGALDISIRRNGCLIVEKDQILHLSVRNPSDEDSVENVKIQLTPSESLFSVLSPQNGAVYVTHLAPLEEIEFPIRIRAQKSTAGACTFCSLNIAIEEQNVRKKVDLSFYEPFIYFYQTKVMKDNHIMLQVTIECTTPEPLDIVGYKLDPKAGVDLVTDFNSQLQTKPRRLLPDQAMSFVFIVSVANTLLEIHKSILQVSYQPLASEVVSASDIPISFSTITRRPYRTEISSVGKIVLGEFCRFDVEIRGILNTKVSSIMCQISGSEWLVVGKNTGLLEESNAVATESEERVWQFNLEVVPLVSGFTKFPKIELSGISSEKIEFKYRSKDGNSVINGPTIFVQPSNGEVAGPLYPLNFPTPKSGLTKINSEQQIAAESLSELDEISGISENALTPQGNGLQSEMYNVQTMTLRDFERISLEPLASARGEKTTMTLTSRNVYESIQMRTMAGRDHRDDDSL